MTRQGKRTPQPIQDYIVETARAAPWLTHDQIAVQIAVRFGEDARIDKSTVGKIRRKHVLSGGLVTEDANLAANRHWCELTETAKRLRAGVAGGAPLPQLMGFPWRSSPNHNGGLVISEREDEPYSMSVERSHLAAALRQHLPSHAVWALLAGWKAAVRGLAEVLRSAVDEAEKAVELHSRGLITREEIEEGAVGFTRWYPASAVLDSAEQKSGETRHLHGYEIWCPARQRRWALVWTRDTSSHLVLAAFDDEVDAEEARSEHEELSQRLLSHPCLASANNAQQALVRAAESVDADLEAISHLVVFPGGCSLYAGTT